MLERNLKQKTPSEVIPTVSYLKLSPPVIIIKITFCREFSKTFSTLITKMNLVGFTSPPYGVVSVMNWGLKDATALSLTASNIKVLICNETSFCGQTF